MNRLFQTTRVFFISKKKFENWIYVQLFLVESLFILIEMLCLATLLFLWSYKCHKNEQFNRTADIVMFWVNYLNLFQICIHTCIRTLLNTFLNLYLSIDAQKMWIRKKLIIFQSTLCLMLVRFVEFRIFSEIKKAILNLTIATNYKQQLILYENENSGFFLLFRFRLTLNRPKGNFVWNSWRMSFILCDMAGTRLSELSLAKMISLMIPKLINKNRWLSIEL